jgi:hypothetical protein
VTLAVPDVVAVKVEVQVAVAVVPDRVHVVKLPVTPVWLRVRVPVGVVAPVVDWSVTDTLQVEPWLATTGVVQLTVVIVTCNPTVTGKAVLVLEECVESPL